MVRVDRDLKRSYFYRNKVVGDVHKPQTSVFGQPIRDRHENEHRVDIIPYNPHIRKQRSKSEKRHKSRRIGWSREADHVRTISPRSEPEHDVQDPEEIYVRPRSYSEDEIFENKPIVVHEAPIVQEIQTPQKQRPSKKKTKAKKSSIQQRQVQEPDKMFYPRKESQELAIKPATMRKVTRSRTRSKSKSKSKPRKRKEVVIRERRDDRYQVQKSEQQKRLSTRIKKSKSEPNLIAVGQKPRVNEFLMKQPEARKKKKSYEKAPPRWRDVGDRDRRQRNYDKLAKPVLSDYYF